MNRFTSRRVVATALHALCSLVVAAAAALVVFWLWYPPPFASMAGGLSLFGLMMGVDVVLGPTLTAVIANPAKPLPAFRRDFIVIVLVQLCALGYGLYTLALARPVYVAFEVDRFRVVASADVDADSLAEAPESLRALPWTGPVLIAAVKPTDPAEQLRAIELGLAGFDLSMLPRYWRSYESSRGEAWRVARPVGQLVARYPQAAAKLAQIAVAAGQAPEALRFLPLLSRQASWVTLLAGPDARVVGHLPLDGFF